MVLESMRLLIVIDGLYMITNPFIINSIIKEFGFSSPSSCLNLTYYLT